MAMASSCRSRFGGLRIAGIMARRRRLVNRVHPQPVIRYTGRAMKIVDIKLHELPDIPTRQEVSP